MRSLTTLRRVALVAVLSCWLSASATSASALVGEAAQVVGDNLMSFAEYARLEGLDPNATCGQACGDLIADLQRPATAPKDPVPASFVKSLFDNRFSVKPMFRLNAAMTGRLSVAGALVAGNYYVWKNKVFGAHPKDYYIHLSAAATSLANLSWQWVDGTYDGWYLGDQKPDPLPVGVIATTYSRSAIIWQEEDGGDGRCDEMPLEPTPPDVEVYSWVWNKCFAGWGGPTGQITAPNIGYGWQIKSDTLFDPSLDPAGRPNTPQTISFDADDTLSDQDIEDRYGGFFASDDPTYETLGTWACAVFGGPCRNPRDAHHTTPDCTGMTASACTQAFRDAGFTGDITTEALSSDDAIMEQDPGKVTATYPHEGIEIAEPRPVTIYRNPDPMPTMTTVDTTIADTLEDQNPGTVDGDNKKTIARTCAGDMQRAGRPASDCVGLPIMVVGNDQETPARNALQGLLRNPAWIVLNARVSKDLNRNSWYLNLGEPPPGCLNAERPAESWSCDEYPFWSTLQAHNGTLNPGVAPSIRWAPWEEHKRQASVINQFYSRKNPGPKMTFAGCDIAKQASTDVLPLPASTFIVLPLPFSSSIASTGVCNKPVVHDDTPDPTEDPNP